MEIVLFELLKERLTGKNLSEVARNTQIPKSLLHDWVGSNRLPSSKNMKYVKFLADYLGLTLDEIFFGEQEKKVISSISFEDSGRKYQVNIERLK